MRSKTVEDIRHHVADAMSIGLPVSIVSLRLVTTDNSGCSPSPGSPLLLVRRQESMGTCIHIQKMEGVVRLGWTLRVAIRLEIRLCLCLRVRDGLGLVDQFLRVGRVAVASLHIVGQQFWAQILLLFLQETKGLYYSSSRSSSFWMFTGESQSKRVYAFSLMDVWRKRRTMGKV